MTVVDNAVYVDGYRRAEPASLERTFELLEQHAGTGRAFAWIGLYRPDRAEIESVAAEFDLHELAVEDAVHAHQRPKLERYGETSFVVLRAARYLDVPEEVEFGELHLFVGTNFVVTVRHAEQPRLAPVRRRMEEEPELLKLGPDAVLYVILDRVVDDYGPVVRGLQNDVDEVETEVFGGEPSASRRIYQLSREVIGFQRACGPLADVLNQLTRRLGEDAGDVELVRRLRDVRDHATAVIERVDAFHHLLSNILMVNNSLVAQRQNEETVRLTETSLAQNEEIKRISSWAAILFTPTLVGTVYGMNFTHMPELDWAWGYPMSLLLMLLVAVLLFIVFKRRGWL